MDTILDIFINLLIVIGIPTIMLFFYSLFEKFSQKYGTTTIYDHLPK